MIASGRLGILGGTFDPIHFGHLDAADAAHRALNLDQVWLVPSSDPPHRPLDPVASAFQRFALITLAIQDRDALRASDLELRRSGTSYTADTLRALAGEGWQASQIFFIIGTDAFAEIATWHDYPAVLDLAHFAVVTRPGTPATPTRSAGISYVNADTPDISSTDIRSRLAAGLSIADLVPRAVERYILNHRLYSAAVNDLHGETERIHR